MSHKHTVFTMNSALFSKTSVFTMNYAHFSLKTVSSSKTTVFTMNYALFFKNHSFYNELYTVRLGAILGPFWHREGSMPEPSRAEPGRAGPQVSQVSPQVSPLPRPRSPRSPRYLGPKCVKQQSSRRHIYICFFLLVTFVATCRLIVPVI